MHAHFKGGDKAPGGQPPPRGSEMTTHCELNVPGGKKGWLGQKLFLYGGTKCKRGANDTFHSFDPHPNALQMTPFRWKIERFCEYSQTVWQRRN